MLILAPARAGFDRTFLFARRSGFLSGCLLPCIRLTLCLGDCSRLPGRILFGLSANEPDEFPSSTSDSCGCLDQMGFLRNSARCIWHSLRFLVR